MKFLIQKIDGELRHDFAFTLLESIRFNNWLGRKMSYRFIDTKNGYYPKFLPLHKNYIPIGSVEFVIAFLQYFHSITPKPINIPDELLPLEHTQRFVFNGVETEIQGKKFVKSNDSYKSFADIVNDNTDIPMGNYQISDVIEIESEWRAFVYNGKLVGLQRYAGYFTQFPDIFPIRCMINAYKSAPIAYTLDVGINANGTFIIECHPMVSVGLYGFSDHTILPYMFARAFNEIKTINLNYDNKKYF